MFTLNSENYWTWKTQMVDFLCVRDLYETIKSKDAVDGINDREWKILSRKAVAIIRQFVDDSVHQNVASYTNAFELWSKLEKARRRDLTLSSKNGADMVQDRGRGMRKNGDSCNRDKSKGRSNSNSKSKVICYHCQNQGHIKNSCPTMKRNKDNDEVRKQ
ncbi:hypothetical protein POM88_047009 [Heracleum sosnowskyi]|uniref:CCHC-type domain-containing protein n=1 Tax=Heracleum sosnowskyi TaxID=360622 RepID=A0AAD8M563_9APIA|nr:hypothetical protein POM88_047009 [Heracleum sosnowskyi]